MKHVLALAMIAALEASAIASPTAEGLYAQGQAEFDAAHYVEAIAAWQESYRLSGASGLLFNLAQAYQLNNDCAKALTTYRRVIAIDPRPDDRADAAGFISALEPQCGAHAAARVVDHSPPSETAGRSEKLAALVTGSGGVVLLVVGVALNHHASTLGDDVTRACTLQAPCDWGTEKSVAAAGTRDTSLGWTFGTIGVLAIGTGAVLYYLGDRAEHATPVSITPRDGGAVASWSGSW